MLGGLFAAHADARDTAAASSAAAHAGARWNAAAKPTALRWPTPRLSAPAVVEIPERGGEIVSLAAGHDFVLRFATGKRYGPLRIHGGRNIVLVGGEHIIDNTTSATYSDRRLFEFRDQTGIVHIEGYYGHGPGLTEGFNLYMPNGILQIQNSRVEGVKTMSQNTAQHPDIIQTWSGPKELRLWNFTGTSNYQGFWFSRADAEGAWPRKVVMERINLRPLVDPSSGRSVDFLAMALPSAATEFRTAAVWIDTGWWRGSYRKGLKDSLGLRWTASAGWSASNPLWGWREFRSGGRPAGPEHRNQPQTANRSDAVPPRRGDFILFTRPAEDNIWNGARTGPGRIHHGVPFGGDYAPAAKVGSRYRHQ